MAGPDDGVSGTIAEQLSPWKPTLHIHVALATSHTPPSQHPFGHVYPLFMSYKSHKKRLVKRRKRKFVTRYRYVVGEKTRSAQVQVVRSFRCTVNNVSG